MRFSCPHCNQAYYGTSSSGLLTPSEFECVCGKRISMEEMSLEPAGGVGEDDANGAPNAWMNRERIGLGRAWLRSTFAILGDPAAFIRGVPANAPLSDAVLYASISAAFGAAFAAVMMLLGAGFAFVIMGTAFGPSRAVSGGAMALLTAIGIQLANAVTTIVTGLVAGFIAHAVLVLLRGARAGLGRSVPAMLYAQGATSALGLLVCCPCNGLVSPVWWCVALTAMFRTVHMTSTGRAVTAAVVAFLAWVGMSFGTSWMLSSAMTGTLTTNASGSAIHGADLRAKNGPYPTPFDAVADGGITAADTLDLIAPRGGALPGSGRIAGLTRASLEEASPATWTALARQLEPLLPSDNAPFRLGQAIFLYRDAPDGSRAWHVVVMPDPATPDEEASWFIIRRGSWLTADAEEFDERLVDENARRRSAQRPPIAELATYRDLLGLPAMQLPLVPAGTAPATPSPPSPPPSG